MNRFVLPMTAQLFFLVFGSLIAGPAIADDFFDEPVSRMTFDCLPGPGYMRINIVNRYLQNSTRTIWASDGDDLAMCKSQADLLRSTRSTITDVTYIGVCSGTSSTDAWYLRRYAVNQYGSMRPSGLINQESKEACLENAALTNASF